MKKKSLLIFLFIFLISNSFYNATSTSIDDIYVVSCLFVDLDEEGQMEMLFISPKASDDKEAQKNTEYEARKGSGESTTACIQSAENAAGKEIFVGHLKSIILGQNIASSEIKMRELYDFFERSPTFNFFTSMMFTKNSAKDLEALLKDKEASVTDFFDNIIRKYPSRRFFNKNYNEIINEGPCYVIPMLSLEKSMEYSGMALFKNGIFLKSFDNDAAILYRMATGTTYENFISTDTSDIIINTSRSKIKRYDDLNFEITIRTKATLIDTTANVDFERDQGEDIEEEMEEKIIKDLYSLHKNALDAGGDIFGLEKYMERYHYDDYKAYKDMGINILDNCNIKFKVDTLVLKNATMY